MFGHHTDGASPSGNRTPVFRVTSGDTVLYTNKDSIFGCVSARHGTVLYEHALRRSHLILDMLSTIGVI